jgi:hypothetical protein
MQDFGEYYRKRFLDEEHRSNKTLYYVLYFGAVYFSIHIVYYLMKT